MNIIKKIIIQNLKVEYKTIFDRLENSLCTQDLKSSINNKMKQNFRKHLIVFIL